MTKSELRKARKLAVANGEKLTGELAIKHNAHASKRTINRKNSRKRKQERERSLNA